MEIKKGMSLNDLLELAKSNPEYKQLYYGLATIDTTIQGFAKDIIEDTLGEDTKNYFIKTEFQNQCYSLMIYSSIREAIVGVSWPMADFLLMCSDKRLEMELNTKVKKMLLRFEDKKLKIGNKINWIY